MMSVRSISAVVPFLLLTLVFVNGSLFRLSRSRIHQTVRFPNTQNVELSMEQENLEVWEEDPSVDFSIDSDVDGIDDDAKEVYPPPYLSLFNLAFEEPESSKTYYNGHMKEISVSVFDCGSPGAIIKNCSINGCTRDPCVVRKGSNMTLAVTFVAKKAARNMWCSIQVKSGIFTRNFTCSQTDMCNARGMRCPLRPQSQYMMGVSTILSSWIPSWSYNMEARLRDNGGTLICIRANVKIV